MFPLTVKLIQQKHHEVLMKAKTVANDLMVENPGDDDHSFSNEF